MSKKFYSDGLPAWHRFELIVRDALRPHLPGGDRAGILLNRRLGHEYATEADLLYAGIREGRSVMVIVECKNRPIEVSGSTIKLPEKDSETPKDLMAQLAQKAHHARVFLGVEDVFFIVVGCTKSPFSERVSSDIFAVGQPIARWADPIAEHDFSPLTSTWLNVTSGIEALRLDSADYAKLRDLPRFAPWDTVQAEELRQDLELERLICEMDYLRRESLNDLAYGDWLKNFASECESGWFYAHD